ncbi:hypothetical protein D3C80_913340 [compost metagenome]
MLLQPAKIIGLYSARTRKGGELYGMGMISRFTSSGRTSINPESKSDVASHLFSEFCRLVLELLSVLKGSMTCFAA